MLKVRQKNKLLITRFGRIDCCVKRKQRAQSFVHPRPPSRCAAVGAAITINSAGAGGVAVATLLLPETE